VQRGRMHATRTNDTADTRLTSWFSMHCPVFYCLKYCPVVSCLPPCRYQKSGVLMKTAVLYWHFVDIVWIAVYGIIYAAQL
jgi:heme/copper-type cytochrome/quinol oxidase subunit 3